MPLYSVIQPIKVGGKVHKPGGDPVELSEAVAAGLAGYVGPARDQQTKEPAATSDTGPAPNNPPPPTATPKKTAVTKSATPAKKATKRQAK
ncbi:hypothetical protein [Bordetella bronchiseptica]|uniref:Uncharacterized protein n=1 Tax=Bordetella bronchiseptica (strain ATCC BAA-588 / NCTC 13252 / RB50) TaxID=257310 RepID=A0A0H3M0Y5_BORBR|nr:hypothetical protein [Bordetella bronchiseptica]KAK64436.1 hypothetical protein AZ22_3663 [Bordetella bronchiseptica 980-2]KDD64581.1 hypothetical protein L533_3836 [Bordetella bronchiseptica OSU553]AMG89706.1 hypothetical protein AL472_19615 [Bordetella bronchiseptica]KCV51075.1 hypothetical protein L491_3704 [Bordetella bronchiseptica 3E44]KCV61603.1 hypothetical protein AZ14_3788 [Bordetella bronchiseptica 980]